jgi:hypothetical protein
MANGISVRRRPRRATPMRSRRIGGLAHASAGPARSFPGTPMPEPPRPRERLVSGAFSLALHGLVIGAVALAALLAPPQFVEELIEITRIRDEPALQEPAPAPRVLAESSGRFDPAPMAVAPQVVNPAVVQRAAPVVSAERIQVETGSPVQAPREVQRAARVVDQARAFQSVAQASASPVAVDAEAPAIRGPVELEARGAVTSGPRQVARVGDTVGVAEPTALGTGSSVREGIAAGRDVLGARTGVQAQVNWAVGDGLGRGSGGTGTGEGAVTWEDCMARPSVQAYLDRVRQRVLSRWALPAEARANQTITLRFVLDPAGTASRVDFVSGGDAHLGESAAQAMRSASPFDQMNPEVRCLAGNPIQATFRNPAVATN